MPTIVRAARFIMIVQLTLGLFSTAVMIPAAVAGEFGWRTLVHLATILPLAIFIGLLTPSAARRFDR